MHPIKKHVLSQAVFSTRVLSWEHQNFGYVEESAFAILVNGTLVLIDTITSQILTNNGTLNVEEGSEVTVFLEAHNTTPTDINVRTQCSILSLTNIVHNPSSVEEVSSITFTMPNFNISVLGRV